MEGAKFSETEQLTNPFMNFLQKYTELFSIVSAFKLVSNLEDSFMSYVKF